MSVAYTAQPRLRFEPTIWRLQVLHSATIRYDTIEEFNVDLKAEYLALSSIRNRKKYTKV